MEVFTFSSNPSNREVGFFGSHTTALSTSNSHTHSPICSATAPIFPDCTPSIAQRASKGWLPTQIGLGSCAPIDVYSTEQSSVDTVFHSILTTEDVTGREECRSSKSGNEGRTGEFQGIKVRRQSNRGKFILERKQRNYRGATEHQSCAASV
jgi:hypothetical protein